MMQTLAKFGSDAKAAVPVLRRLIKELEKYPDNDEFCIAIRTVHAIDPEEPSFDKQMKWLNAEDGPEQPTERLVFEFLGELGTKAPKAVDVLEKRIERGNKYNDKYERTGSYRLFEAEDGIKTLGKIGDDAVPALIRLLKDEHSKTRQYAAATLGTMGKPARPAVPILIEALRNQDYDEQINAACALWLLEKHDKAKEYFTESLKSDLATLKRKNDPLLSSPSADAVKSYNRALRIILFLGDRGPEAKPFLSLLKQWQQSKELRMKTAVREVIEGAIEKIGASEGGDTKKP